MSNKKQNYSVYYSIETQDFCSKDNPEDLKDFWNWVEVDRVGRVGPNLKRAKEKYAQLSEKYNTLRLVRVEFTVLKTK